MSESRDVSVSVRDLVIRYGELTVLDRLNLEISKGEFLVLLGSSGCGKSTLLNAIAGLNDISEGQIWISGRNVTWAEPKDRGIGMVFQSYALYPRMTVEQNLDFGLRIAGVAKAEIARRVARAAKILRLEPLLKRRPSELSGGQRQRVAIGRALVRDVDVFLFDEPLSNLDAQLRSDLRVEIKRLHQTLGNTMIYVTHDQIEAMTLADRIAIMKGGIIQQLDTPHAVYNHPVNRFVAGFIGSPAMNFLEGHYRAIDNHIVLGSVALPLERYDFSAPRPQDGLPITLGLRPEHIIVHSAHVPSEASFTWCDGEVSMIEPTGADTIVWSEVAGQPITLRLASDQHFVKGQTIRFGLHIARGSVFAADSGQRL